MEMTIGKFVYTDYPEEEYDDLITIEVTDLDGEFISQYTITFEEKDVVDYSGVAELDEDDIKFIQALGFNTDEI